MYQYGRNARVADSANSANSANSFFMYQNGQRPHQHYSRIGRFTRFLIDKRPTWCYSMVCTIRTILIAGSMKGDMGKLKEKILEVLRDSGGWMSRAEIAQALNRPTRLQPYDVELIEELISEGLVEQEKELVGTVKEVYKYRAK